MHRRSLLSAAAGLGAALGGCLGGSSDRIVDARVESPTPVPTADPGGLSLRSPAFDGSGPIPREYTCDGVDASPPLGIDGVPDAAAALALVVDDPDAPGGTFTHWLLWNLPPGTASIPEGTPSRETLDGLGGARQGTNGFGEVGYRGPCPPRQDGAHTYRFTLFALDATLDLDPGAGRAAFDDAVAGAVLARTTLRGTYGR